MGGQVEDPFRVVLAFFIPTGLDRHIQLFVFHPGEAGFIALGQHPVDVRQAGDQLIGLAFEVVVGSRDGALDLGDRVERAAHFP